MPEQPIPEQDPVVTKSYALYYVVCDGVAYGDAVLGALG